jgi:hypothetical protein
MDHNEMEQKKRKLGRWLEIGFYALVVLWGASKVLPIFWRILLADTNREPLNTSNCIQLYHL